MGNWKNRPSRRWHYNQDRRPPKSYYDSHPPTCQEYVEDGVPVWEKEFCYAVGAVPWHKVVDAKKFSYCQSQVLKWDDSAGKEAFHNAKKRYWAVINGLPCDVPPPDPNACIDEINWNPYIDAELIRELEQEYFAPVDDERNFGNRKKKTKNLFSHPLEGCSMNPGDDAVNPWGAQNFVQISSAAVNAECQGWGDQWDDNLKESNDSNKADNNPWEKACHQGDEAVDGSRGWPVLGDNSLGWNPSSVYVATKSNGWVSGGNTWEGNGEATSIPSKTDGWGEFRDRSWGDNRYHPRRLKNGQQPREGSFEASGTQNDSGWRNKSSSQACVGKKWDEHAAEEPKNSNYRKPGWGTWNKDSWRNDGGHQDGTGYSRTRPRFDDGNYEYRAGGHPWRGKKRVSFGYS
ncbi:unnamed protein product [Linum tenue]|uniref:Uncharacterized protein n=1 Tax=Linum tenue TaxID=586396 RepID=A0AAV0RUV1_9ROSI|nr:unnamed protein product [Linum tenue]